MKKDFQLARLRKIIQRLKSLILQEVSADERENLKAELQRLDELYLAGKLPFEDYKIQAPVLLLKSHRDVSWVEQWLYRETGNFYTPEEKFTICQQVEETPVTS